MIMTKLAWKMASSVSIWVKRIDKAFYQIALHAVLRASLLLDPFTAQLLSRLATSSPWPITTP